MRLDWRQATHEETSYLKEALPGHLGRYLPKKVAQTGTAFRATDLRFYEGVKFVEVTVLKDRKSMFCLCDNMDANSTYVMDWTNRPIYTVNDKGCVRLTEENVADYLGFFFACVQGPYGPMTVVELLEAPEDATEEVKAAVADILKMCPPRVVGRTPTMGFVVYAGMLFKDCVFKTRMTVSQTGLIRIVDHELALGGLNEDEANAVKLASINNAPMPADPAS
jgi:hypothetical protein